MIKQQQEEAERRRQLKINELNLLHKFAEATFEEACFDGLDNILQPIIHMRRERDHCPRQQTDFPPSIRLHSLLPFNDVDDHLFPPLFLLALLIILTLQLLELWLAPFIIL